MIIKIINFSLPDNYCIYNFIQIHLSIAMGAPIVALRSSVCFEILIYHLFGSTDKYKSLHSTTRQERHTARPRGLNYPVFLFFFFFFSLHFNQCVTGIRFSMVKKKHTKNSWKLFTLLKRGMFLRFEKYCPSENKLV